MIKGIGTDLVYLDRLEGELGDPEGPFFRLVYTERERAEAAERPSPRYYYATRFAGKEAVFKCLGEFPGETRLGEIEILAGPRGEPRVTLRGALGEYAAARGVERVHLSLSYERDCALAFAVAEGPEI